MQVRRLVIADETEEFAAALADILRGSFDLRVCHDGRKALELIQSFRPDVLVVDLMLPGLDGLSLLQSETVQQRQPIVLATSRFISDYVLESLSRLGVGFVMAKPCDVQAAATHVAELSSRLRTSGVTGPDDATLATNMLMALGFRTKVSGFPYLREAIVITAQKPGLSITKELYPMVAQRCGSEPALVERSARSAIETAFQRRNKPLWQLYFSGMELSSRPTNAEFITRLAEMLRQSREGNYPTMEEPNNEQTQ